MGSKRTSIDHECTFPQCGRSAATVNEGGLTKVLGTDRFVAYDPKNGGCTAADRSFIKQLAGKHGAKIRRPRQKRASLAQGSSNAPATRFRTADHEPQVPDYTDAGFCAQFESSELRGSPPQVSAAISKPCDETDQTSSTSVCSTTYPTPARSETSSKDLHDYFTPCSEFEKSNAIIYGRQGGSRRPQYNVARCSDSFDSGFQGSNSLDFDLTGLNEPCDVALDAHSFTYGQGIPNLPSVSHPSADSRQRDRTVHSGKDDPGGLCQEYEDLAGTDSVCDGSRQLNNADRLGQFDLSTPSMMPSPLIEPPPSRQLSPQTSSQSQWPNIDSALIEWVHCEERQGQLCAGSSKACLDVLSECEELRSLWSLNLSLANPKRILCFDRPNDVYTRARCRLLRMTLAQRLDVEGTLLKLGIVEYVSVCFALEVTSLQQNVATRKELGIRSTAEAIVEHRLTGLAPATRSLLSHLRPDGEE